MATLTLQSARILANGRIIETVFTVAPVPGSHSQADWRPGQAAGARVTLSSGATCEHIQTWCTPYDLASDFEAISGGSESTALAAGSYFTQWVVKNASGAVIAVSQQESVISAGGKVTSYVTGAYGLAMPAGYTIDVYLTAANGSASSPMYRYIQGQTSTYIHYTAGNPSVSNPTYPPAGYTPSLKWTSRWRIPVANLVQLGQAVSISAGAGVLQDSAGNATAAFSGQALSPTTEGTFTNFSLVDSTGFTSDAILPDSTGRTFYVSSTKGSDSHTAAQAQSMATPWQTPAHACAAVYGSYNNQWNAVLLRRGDTFTAGFNTSPSGKDPWHPFTIGSYWNPADGIDPAVRPLFAYPNSGGGTVGTEVGSSAPPDINHVVVRGLNLQCVHPSDTSVASKGINWGIPGRNIVFEDMLIQDYANNVNCEIASVAASTTPVLTGLMFHRCIIIDAYNVVAGQPSAGFNVSAVKQFVVSESVVDRNGYLSSSHLTTDLFSHNSHGSARTYPELWFEMVNRFGGSNGVQFRDGGCAAYCIFSNSANQHFQAGFGGTAATRCVFEKARDIAQSADSYTSLAGSTTWTHGSATVTGSGTSFTALTAGLGNGASLIRVIGTRSCYPVASIQSNTQLTLLAPFAGVSAAGAAAEKTSIALQPRGNNCDVNYGRSNPNNAHLSGFGAVYELSLVINNASANNSAVGITIENDSLQPLPLAVVRNMTAVRVGTGLALPASLPAGATQILERLILPSSVTGVTLSSYGVPTFVNGTADMGDYYASLGGPNDEQAYINMLRARPWRVWASKYDPANIVAYYWTQYKPTGLASLGTGPWDYYGAVDYRVLSPPPTLISIAVTPTNPTIVLGTTEQFTATGTYTSGPPQNVTSQVAWSSATTGVATIASDGLATSVAVGSSVISATLSGVTGQTTLTVTPATLVSIAVTPANPSIAAGTTVQMHATGTYSNFTTANLTGQVAWAAGATIATITSAGLVTGHIPGTQLITATLSGISDSTALTVLPATLVSIVVTPNNPSVAKGLNQQFVATGTYTDSSTQTITSQVAWTSSAPTKATIGSTGLATTLATGTTTISANLSGVSDSTVLTVTAATLVSIAVTPANPSVAKGLTEQFTATGTYTDSSTQNLTGSVAWTSSAPTKATIGSTGLATTLATGTTTISANLSGISDSTTLTVTAATLVSIAVTPTNPSIVKGTTEQFTATGTYTDSSTQDLTGSATWSSGTTGVATIVAGGLATSVAAGSSVIKATLSGIAGSTTLTVTPATLVSIAVTPAAPSIVNGMTQQFTATGTYSDSSTQNLTGSTTWSSGTTGVATIVAGGLATSVAAGSSVITATSGSVHGQTTLTVTALTLVSIAVTPANPSIVDGETQQFTATGTYNDSSTADLTGSTTWSSGTTGVATIVSGGLATSVAAGSSVITATSGSVHGQTTLTVLTATLSSIAVTPANPTIAAGTTEQFTATGTYSDSSTLNLTSQVAWSSGTPSHATIVAGGLATGVAIGTSVVTATLNAVNGTTLLTVSAATLVSIAVTPANPSVAKGLTEQFTATGTYTNSSTQDLTGSATWSSATTGVATIASGGLATSVAAGSSVITATSGSVHGQTTLTVTAATLVSIAVTPANPSVAKGLTEQFVATGTFTDSSTQDLTGSATWSSATTGVATIASDGLATSVAVGSSVITATSGSVNGQTTLTVTAATLVSIAVTPTAPSMAKGLTEQFTATGTFTDSSTQDITTSSVWSSTLPSIATVGAGTGLATAVAAGTTSIHAAKSSLLGSTTLTVTAATLVSIAVTPANPSVVQGQGQQFTATGTFTDNSTQTITAAWASATPSVATIGAGTGVALTLTAGSTVVSATVGGISGSTTLTVTAPTLVSIAVTPANPSVVLPGTEQFTATGTFTDLSTQDITTTSTWSSTSPAVATVGAGTGLASSIAAGTTSIHAAKSSLLGSTTLTVTAPTLVSIAVTPANPSIVKGYGQQFTATGTLTDGTTPDLTSQVAWSSATPATATIGAGTGLATGLLPGSSVISATLSGVTGQTTLTVTDPAALSMVGIVLSDGRILAFKVAH